MPRKKKKWKREKVQKALEDTRKLQADPSFRGTPAAAAVPLAMSLKAYVAADAERLLSDPTRSQEMEHPLEADARVRVPLRAKCWNGSDHEHPLHLTCRWWRSRETGRRGGCLSCR